MAEQDIAWVILNLYTFDLLSLICQLNHGKEGQEGARFSQRKKEEVAEADERFCQREEGKEEQEAVKKEESC